MWAGAEAVLTAVTQRQVDAGPLIAKPMWQGGIQNNGTLSATGNAPAAPGAALFRDDDYVSGLHMTGSEPLSLTTGTGSAGQNIFLDPFNDFARNINIGRSFDPFKARR